MSQSSYLFNGNAPVTFLGWLESQNIISKDFNVNFKKYQEYVVEWSEYNKNRKQLSEDFFASIYIDLLKEITLNFVTEEERRFVINFDYTKEENLDIVLPFFIEKLKNICLYYSKSREKLKEKITYIPYTGTNLHVQKLTKQIITENYESGFILKQNEGKVSFPSLSSITKSLDIYVEEIYDDKDYYNKRTDNVQSVLNFGNVDIDPDLYINFKNAIKRAIEQYPLYLESLMGGFAINYTLSGTELNYLKERDFLNYVNTLSSDELKINLQKQLFPKYVSSNFYYLSVGSTINTVASGKLFDVDEYGKKTSNLTNRSEGTVATVQSLNDIYTGYEMGKFFIPSKTGVLQYNTFNKSYEINFSKLSPNSIYVFPDPNIVQIDDTPITYKIDVSWNKQDIGAGANFGNILSDGHFQRFYPYQSYSQDLGYQPHGLSLAVDNIDFWSGDRDSVWTEEDLWPGVDKIETLQIKERFKSLLFNEGTCTEWYTDIYGNEFGLYKQVEEDNKIFYKKRILPGKLYVKNTVTNLVSSIEYFLQNTFNKYPQNIREELEESTYSFYVVKSVIVIETKNHVIIESYNFDFSTGEFLLNLLPGLYFPKHEINDYLEKYIGSFYIDKFDDLYLCFTKLLPNLSASNYKTLYPHIIKINTNSLNIEQVYPNTKFNSTIYSLSSNQFKQFPEINLKYIEGGKFSFKEKFNIFNLTYCAYNENDLPFYINEQFSLENNNTFVSYSPILNKPYYYVHDANFSNPQIDTTIRFGASYSEQIGSKLNESFRWTKEEKNIENYHFCSKINPVFINYPGLHFVQFDWTQYINGNMFLGCDNLQASYIDGKNFVTFNNRVTEIKEEDVWYNIADVQYENINYTLSAYKPFNSLGSVLGFAIYNDLAPSSAIFCDNLFSVYKTVNLFLIGSGFGRVESDPYCVECSKTDTSPNVVKCSFQYPIFNTITFKASSSPNSLFNGWRGGSCDGTVGDCFYIVSNNTNNISAVFNKIPRYTLTVNTNISGTKIVTLDGKIDCNEGPCKVEYVDGTLVGVSAGPAPLGMQFQEFKGIDQGTNNPVIFNMSTNYSLTAVYVSATNNIDIYNYFNVKGNNERKFGYLMGSPKTYVNNTEPIAIVLNPGKYVLAWNQGIKQTGSLTLSLSPDENITGFASFTLIRDTRATISATSNDSRYIFEKFVGSPCDAAINSCTFNTLKNYSVSAFFNFPIYNVTVYNAGDEVFYTVSNDGNLDAGTLILGNERNKTSYNYISGTVITLSSFAVGDPGVKGMRYISDGINSVTSPEPIFGSEYLILDLPVTRNAVVTAFCERSATRPNLTLIKTPLIQGVNIPELINTKLFATEGTGVITFTLENNVLQNTTSVFPPFVPIEFTPFSTPSTLNYKFLSGLNFYAEMNPVLPLVITNSSKLFNGTVLSKDSVIVFTGDGKSPVYIDDCEGLISIDSSPKFYTTLNSDLTGLPVYSKKCILSNYNFNLNVSRLDAIAGRNPNPPCPRVNTWCEYYGTLGEFITGAKITTSSFLNTPSIYSAGVDIFCWPEQTISYSVVGGTLNNHFTEINSVVEGGSQKKTQLRFTKNGTYTVFASVQT